MVTRETDSKNDLSSHDNVNSNSKVNESEIELLELSM